MTSAPGHHPGGSAGAAAAAAGRGEAGSSSNDSSRNISSSSNSNWSSNSHINSSSSRNRRSNSYGSWSSNSHINSSSSSSDSRFSQCYFQIELFEGTKVINNKLTGDEFLSLNVRDDLFKDHNKINKVPFFKLYFLKENAKALEIRRRKIDSDTKPGQGVRCWPRPLAPPPQPM